MAMKSIHWQKIQKLKKINDELQELEQEVAEWEEMLRLGNIALESAKQDLKQWKEQHQEINAELFTETTTH